MIRRINVLRWIGCWLLLAGTAANAERAHAGSAQLTIYTEDLPPYNFPMPASGINSTTTVTGISTDIVQELMNRTHITYSITLDKWEHGYDRTVHTPNTCIYTMTMTYKRRALFKWVGPLTQTQWILMATGSNPVRLESLDDARKYSIGVAANGTLRSYLQDQGGFRLKPAESGVINIRELQSGAIDLWATDKFYSNWTLKQLGLSGAIHEVLQFHEPTLVGLACNLDTPDNLISALNQALKSLRRDGTHDRIEARYLK